MSDPDVTQPTPKPQAPPTPGATPTGYQRTTGGKDFRWEPPSAEELQSLMPGYIIEKILGRGGMGAVYRGVQTNLDRPVAIKILPPGVEREDPSFAERFKSEAKLMAKLNHPAVVAVYDFGTTLGGQLYFAMEYVDGSDVAQMISAQGKLPPEHALAITAHVCDALQAAHELGIVHRDIKPANVLINMKGQVKVADFGLAKVEEPGSHGLTKTGYAMGTPDFVAPEALMLGTGIDGRADLYAVGVMLYQMLTGVIPRGAFKPAEMLVPGLDPRFDAIILKAMQTDRAERHQSAAELRRELDVILTVPLVRNDAPVSAAIPVAQVALPPGQRSAAQKPAPQSRPGAATARPAAAAPKADGRASATPILPPKSKAPLFIGLGAAAAIGIGAFVMFGGKKAAKQSGPLTPSSGTSVATAPKPAPAPPKPVPASPNPTVSKSSSSTASQSSDRFPPGQWVKTFTTLDEMGKAGVTLNDKKLSQKDGWFVPSMTDYDIRFHKNIASNVGIRGRFKPAKTAVSLTLYSDSVSYDFNFNSESGALELRRVEHASMLSPRKQLFIGQYAILPEHHDFVVEFAHVEGRFIGRVNDRVVFAILDERRSNNRPSLFKSGEFRDIEVINLDGLPESEALKILGVDEKGNDLRQKPAVVASGSNPSDKFPPGKWVKLFTKAEDLPENLRSKFDFDDGWFTSTSDKWLPVSSLKGANLGIRVKFRRGLVEPGALVLYTPASYYSFQRSTTSDALIILKSEGSNKQAPTTLKTSHGKIAASPQAEYVIEAGVVGNRFAARTSNQEFATFTDGGVQSSFFQIYGREAFRDIEVINLDGLPEAEALKILGVDEKGNDLRQKPAAIASGSESSDPKFPPGQWVKVLTKAADLPEELRKADNGVKFEDGWINPTNPKYRSISPANLKVSKLAMRCRINRKPGILQFDFKAGPAYIKTSVTSGDTFDFTVQDLVGNRSISLMKSERLPPIEDSGLEVEVGLVGANLICRVGSKLFRSTVPSEFLSPAYSPGLFFGTATPRFARDIEVINLDGLTEAEALRILGVDEKGNDLRALAAKQEQQKAEMVQQADAMAAIPELKALHEQFVKLQGERVTAPFEKDVAALNTSYLGGLDRKIAEEKKAGHLDGVLALEMEKTLVAGKQPVPAADDDKTTATLKELRRIYREAHAKLEATRAANLKLLTDPLDTRLKQLESSLTQANRIDHAKTVREYREGLGRDVGTQLTIPEKSSTQMGGIAGSSGKISKREVVEWLLGEVKAAVYLRTSKGDVTLKPGDEVPKGNFTVFRVSALPNSPPWQITDDDLAKIGELEELNDLQSADCPNITGSGFVHLKRLREMRKLILKCPNLQGANLAKLPDFTKLEELGGFGGFSPEDFVQLPALRNLRILETSCVTPSHIKAYAARKSITRLAIGNGSLEDEALAGLTEMVQLEELLIGNSYVTGEGLLHLAKLPNLHYLSYSSSQADPKYLNLITGIPSLTKLSTRGDHFLKHQTEWLSVLTSLAGRLKEFDIGYAKDVPAEVRDQIKRAMPKTKITIRE